jgi:hypothetical protein
MLFESQGAEPKKMVLPDRIELMNRAAERNEFSYLRKVIRSFCGVNMGGSPVHLRAETRTSDVLLYSLQQTFRFAYEEKVMKTTSAEDFEISGMTETDGSEKIFLSGPSENSVILVTREEAAFVANHILHCCSQPTSFTMRVASGDTISISRSGDWILVQLGTFEMFLDPGDARDLSENIFVVWREFRRTTSLAAA